MASMHINMYIHACTDALTYIHACHIAGWTNTATRGRANTVSFVGTNDIVVTEVSDVILQELIRDGILLVLASVLDKFATLLVELWQSILDPTIFLPAACISARRISACKCMWHTRHMCVVLGDRSTTIVLRNTLQQSNVDVAPRRLGTP